HRRPGPEVGPEREGGGRVAGRRGGVRRGPDRALPGVDRVVQEAADRRVRRRPPPSGLGGRLRRPGRALPRRRLPGRDDAVGMSTSRAVAPTVRMGDPSGAYRRSLLIVTREPGVVVADLEDDFHRFRVVLEHDGARVTAVSGEGLRTPW